MAEYLTNTTDLTAVADAIRAKGGTAAQLVYPSGFVSAIQAIQTGGTAKPEQEKTVTITANGTVEIKPDTGKTLSKVNVNVNVPSSGGTIPVNSGDITFYDYDGTVVAAWSAEELSAKTELPAYPSHDGLVCQGWNWTLDELKSSGRKRIPVGALYTTDDNKTRIYIELQEGRTSPILGCCPNGTVTVDWGDGTATETLTGTNLYGLKWTSVHNYLHPGKYIITLAMSEGGRLGFAGSSTENTFGGILRQAKTADVRNVSYLSTVKKIECADHVEVIGSSAFNHCSGLETISIPASLTHVLTAAFREARSLKAFIAGNIGFTDPRQQQLGTRQFENCTMLSVVTFRSTQNSVPSYFYSGCLLLNDVFVVDTASTIKNNAFYQNHAMTYLELPSVINIADKAFLDCYGIRVYDFSHCTSVPSMLLTAFDNIPSDCEIRVPSSLVDEWKADSNWAGLADHIVGV